MLFYLFPVSLIGLLSCISFLGIFLCVLLIFVCMCVDICLLHSSDRRVKWGLVRIIISAFFKPLMVALTSAISPEM